MTELSPLAYDFVGFLEETEALLGDQTFTWKNVEVPCCPSSLGAGTTIRVGPEDYDVELTLIVRRNNFLTADSTIITVDSDLFTADSDMPHPIAGRSLIFRSKTYRILTAKEVAPRSHYELTLGDANQ